MTVRHSFDGAARPGNLTRRHELIGGYFFPLNVARALDGERGITYVADSVVRALREPKSARNVAARRSAPK